MNGFYHFSFVIKAKKSKLRKPVLKLTDKEAYERVSGLYAQISKWSILAENGSLEESKIYMDWIFGTGNTATQELLRLALGGNKQAGKGLLKIVESTVSGLDGICHKNPAMFEPIARKKLYWPAFISKLTESKERNKKLLEILNLGKDSGLNITGKQPNWSSREIEEVLWLYRVIGLWNTPGHPQSSELSKKLPPLNRNNYTAWFEAAWPLFIWHHGKDYEKRKYFSHYWENAAYKGKSNARALIRDAIRKNIKQGFRSIAPRTISTE